MNKRNIITIDFSSIRFLKALETESIRRLQFLQILLMILRTLIILFIILMMTRPVVGGLFTYWDSDNEAIISVVIIDDSFSMHGNNEDFSRLDLIKSSYEDILDNISDNSQIYIATLSKGELYSGIKAKIPELTKLFEIGYLSPNIGDILKNIELEFSDRSALKELYYITDGQKAHLDSALPFKPFLSNWKIFTILLPPIQDNLSVISAHIENAILLPNSPLTINVDVINNGNHKIENKLIQLFVNNISVAQQLITLNANSQNRFEFITAVPSMGDYACHFKLEDDERLEDNYFYFKIDIPEILNVGTIDTKTDGIYMTHLFESINYKNSIIKINKYSPVEIQHAINDANHLLILTGYHALNQAGPDLLEFVGNGGHLIIFPDETDSSSSNLDIFESSYLHGNLKQLSDGNYQVAHISESDINTNLFSGNFEENPIKLFKYFQLPQNKNSIIITDDGHSIYSRYFEGNGMIDIFSISPTLAWSNFPVRGYFIPFFHQLLYSQFSKSNGTNIPVGEKWNISTQVKEGYKKITYSSPSLFEHALDANFTHINYEPIPGIHKLITAEDSIIMLTAMNVEAIELKDSIATIDDLKYYLSPNTSIINIDNGNLNDAIHDSRVGSELWRLILYLIIMLIIIEMIISSNAVRKTSS